MRHVSWGFVIVAPKAGTNYLSVVALIMHNTQAVVSVVRQQ